MKSLSREKRQVKQKFLLAALAAVPQKAPVRNQAKHTVKDCPPQSIFIRGGFASGFDEAVMAQLNQWERFCALALKIDSPADHHPPEGLHAALSQLLEEAGQANDAIHFLWKHDLYLYAIPLTDTAEVLPIADHLQKALARQRVESISIGIAPFPLLAYDRYQTAINACKALDHAAFFGPGYTVVFDAVSLNISGDHYYQDGKMDLAMAEYSAALELDPANVNVQNSLGVCLAKIGDLGAAKKSFENVLQSAPTESMAIYNLGMVQLLKKDLKAAITCFLEAYALNHEAFEIPFQIGKLYIEQEEWEKALGYLDRAIELNDRHDGTVHRLRGQCLASLGETAAAMADFKQAIKRNPNDAEALSALGLLFDARNENHDVCEVFLKQSVDLAPENGLYRHRLACLYQKHRKFDRALKRYEEAAALGHDSHRQIDEVRRQLG